MRPGRYKLISAGYAAAGVTYLSKQIPRFTGNVIVKLLTVAVVLGLFRLVCRTKGSCNDASGFMWQIVNTLPSHAVVRYELDDGQLRHGFYR